MRWTAADGVYSLSSLPLSLSLWISTVSLSPNLSRRHNTHTCCSGTFGSTFNKLFVFTISNHSWTLPGHSFVCLSVCLLSFLSSPTSPPPVKWDLPQHPRSKSHYTSLGFMLTGTLPPTPHCVDNYTLYVFLLFVKIQALHALPASSVIHIHPVLTWHLLCW